MRIGPLKIRLSPLGLFLLRGDFKIPMLLNYLKKMFDNGDVDSLVYHFSECYSEESYSDSAFRHYLIDLPI